MSGFGFKKIRQLDEQTVAGDKMDSKNMILNFGKQEWIPLRGQSKSPLVYLNGKVWTCRTIWFLSASRIFKPKPTSRSQTDGKHTKSIIWGWNGGVAAFHVLMFFSSAAFLKKTPAALLRRNTKQTHVFILSQFICDSFHTSRRVQKRISSLKSNPGFARGHMSIRAAAALTNKTWGSVN